MNRPATPAPRPRWAVGHASFTPLVLVALLVLVPSGRAAENVRWSTTDGPAVEGRLAGVYGPLVLVESKKSRWLATLDQLDSASLGQVADYLALPPPPAPAWATSESGMAKTLRKRLQRWDGNKLVDFDPGPRAEPELYLAYFSAHWCGPCQRFTPGLVQAYQQMKADPAIADRFELVFVSSDRDSKEQETYVRESGMPWPVLKYSQVGRVRLIEQWSGRGIPCLVVLNREGLALFHSYNGDDYLGPGQPLEQVRALLPLLDPAAVGNRLARHPLAVLAHVKQSQIAPQKPKLYLSPLDRANYQGLKLTAFTAKILINEQGTVTDVTTEPELPAVYANQFWQDMRTWLFLPAAEGGVAKSTTHAIAIRF